MSILSVFLLLLITLSQTQGFQTLDLLTTSDAATPTITAPPSSSTTEPPTHDDRIHRNNRNWREYTSSQSTPGCTPLTINSGYFLFLANNITTAVIIDDDNDSNNLMASANDSNSFLLNSSQVAVATAVQYHYAYSSVTFTPHCPDMQTFISNGRRPNNNTNIIEYELGVTPLPGSFYNSVFPTCACLAIAMATVYSTLLILLIQFDKRPIYQLFTVMVSAVTITIAFVQVTKFLSLQAHEGYFDGPEIMAYLISNTTINVLLPINSFFLTMAQVQVLFHVFERRREKIVVFWFGLSLAICLSVLWGISIVYGKLGADISRTEDALTVFSYLFKIANSIMFSGCILLFGIINYKTAYRLEVLVLALLALACSVSPIVLFIQDILTDSIDQWADFADIITLMTSSIVAWEWIERVNGIRRQIEYQSVLGRQYYQEDDDDMSIVVYNNNNKKNDESSSSSKETCSDPNTSAKFAEKEQMDDRETARFTPNNRESPVSWGYNFIKEWLKYPIRRPDTTSSTQTMYLSADPNVLEPNINATAAQQLVHQQQTEVSTRSDLPKFYYQMSKQRDHREIV